VSRLSHLDGEGRASMVDVSDKEPSLREASAEAWIVLSAEAFRLALSGENKKGDVLAVARIAGIMAAKKTSELIPLCHPLALSHVGVSFTPVPERFALRIVASARTTGPTGVEMEALTAAAVAALTVYDMVKAVDKTAMVESIRLLTKSGGKSGAYAAPDAEAPPPPERAPTSAPRGRARPAPRPLSRDDAAPREAPLLNEREALRRFMLDHRLRATEWAKSADVAVNELYGFLSGRARALAPATAEKLARAARAGVDDLFGRKGAR
jgi:molybdenum cofactor biosynthesis protein MoaC